MRPEFDRGMEFMPPPGPMPTPAPAPAPGGQGGVAGATDGNMLPKIPNLQTSRTRTVFPETWLWTDQEIG